MRELILIFSYVICAFVPVLLVRRVRTEFSPGQFWGAWFVSLTGAFAGGVLGTILLARTGIDFGFYIGVIPALLGAWSLFFVYLTLREMPGNW